MKKYDIIYSIGRDCACASYLKQNKLRLTSGPFDWLTNADFESRFDLLLNDFNAFTDKEYLKKMPKPSLFPADKNNDYYENTKNGLYFWHDFPADETFEKAYPKVKQKYERRIKRFYENIKNKNRVLLIWFSQVHNTPDNVIVDLCNRFCQKMGKTIDFLIIEHQENLNTPDKFMLADNIEKWLCHTKKCNETGEPETLGNQELVNPIFSQLQVFRPFSAIVKEKSLAVFLRFLSLLLPVKKWRKKLRAVYKNK